ncbi:MAG TPA: 50S ribosomal protein L25 [Fimbriiglobus sp.]|jgi:large subunit ribosomal protein L25
MAVVVLPAQSRETKGSKAAARLRKQGRIPGVLYGHKEATVAVSVGAEELDRAIRIQHARVLDLDLGGKKETVLIRELQWDYLGRDMVHIDFERVSADERVKVTIPIELRNAPKTTGGGVLEQPLHQLHVECPATSIPEAIRVDITNLLLGSPIHVSDLVLPAGVTVLEGKEMVVVQLRLPGQEAVVAAAPTEVTGTEPEVIKKEKKAEDEEE